MKKIVFFAFFLILTSFSFESWAQNPYSEDTQVRLSIQGNNPGQGFENGLDKFEQSVSRGMDKAGRALDLFAKDLNRLFKNMDREFSSNSTTQRTSDPSSSIFRTVPDRITRSVSYEKGDVSSAFKDFLGSIGNLFKALGRWGKAFWEEITGPSVDEAPITGTINKIKTDYQKWRLGSAWNKFTRDGGDFFKAVGRFAKNLFK